MQVQVWQAALFGLLACLASMPGLGGTVLGNYTLGRPLVAGLIVGLIMGDVQTGHLSRRGHSGRIHRARNAGRHGFR